MTKNKKILIIVFIISLSSFNSPSFAGTDILIRNAKLREIRELREMGNEGIVGDEGVPRLIEFLDDSDEDVRYQAVRILGWTKHRDIVEPFKKLVTKDKSDKVRASAIVWLNIMRKEKRISGESLKPLFLKTLADDSSREVRDYAAAALGGFRTPDVIVPLIEGLKRECELNFEESGLEPKAEGNDYDFISSYITDIGGLRNNESLIEELTSTLRGYLDKGNREFQYSIAVLINYVQKPADKKLLPLLIEALENSNNGTVRNWAAGDLGEIGDEAAIPVLLKALEDDHKIQDDRMEYPVYTVRARAREALKKIKEKNIR